MASPRVLARGFSRGQGGKGEDGGGQSERGSLLLHCSGHANLDFVLPTVGCQ